MKPTEKQKHLAKEWLTDMLSTGQIDSRANQSWHTILYFLSPSPEDDKDDTDQQHIAGSPCEPSGQVISMAGTSKYNTILTQKIAGVVVRLHNCIATRSDDGSWDILPKDDVHINCTDRAPQPACNADLIAALVSVEPWLAVDNCPNEILDAFYAALAAAKRQPCNTKEGV